MNLIKNSLTHHFVRIVFFLCMRVFFFLYITTFKHEFIYIPGCCSHSSGWDFACIRSSVRNQDFIHNPVTHRAAGDHCQPTLDGTGMHEMAARLQRDRILKLFWPWRCVGGPAGEVSINNAATASEFRHHAVASPCEASPSLLLHGDN
jgi:hypothetical protein